MPKIEGNRSNRITDNRQDDTNHADSVNDLRSCDFLGGFHYINYQTGREGKQAGSYRGEQASDCIEQRQAIQFVIVDGVRFHGSLCVLRDEVRSAGSALI